MHRLRIASLFTLTPLFLPAQNAENTERVELSPVTVYSPRVANQESTASYAAPVSALRYEPLADIQARNFAEAQADILVRGGTFESTGFSIGALPIYDPQTGHYLAELPVAPAMLGAPGIRTGADNAINGWAGTAGGVAYAWQPVRSGGFVSSAAGDNNLLRSEAYAGYASDKKFLGRTIAADASVAYSDGEGSRTFGDHRFNRYNARLQLADAASQTDLFVGRQDKAFGWPNMYAARNLATPAAPREEREDLETNLLVLNHAVQFGADGDYLQVGGYLRRNKDHYSIPVFGPFGHSFHTTDVSGAALDGRVTVTEGTAVLYRAGAVADEIGSTSLIVGPVNGRYDDRTQYYTGAFVEHTFNPGASREWIATTGANYDDSNRDSGEVSPTVKFETRSRTSIAHSVYVSYSEASQMPTYTTLNNNNTGGLFVGDRDLGRSTSDNIELGAEISAKSWDFKTAVFFRRDRDLVDWTYDSTSVNTPSPLPPAPPPTSRTAEAVDVDTFGAEFVARRDLGIVALVFGYTFLDKNDDLAANRGSFYALDYAEHRLTAAIIARLGGGFELRMDNEYRIQEENALRSRNDDPFISALGLYYAVPRVKGLTLSAQVDNLWNTYYEEVPLVPGSRREWSVGARYAW